MGAPASDKNTRLLQELLTQQKYMAVKITNDIRDAIAACLSTLGLSTADFAKRLGCNIAVAKDLLRGNSGFHSFTMAEIAIALGCEWHFDLRQRSENKPTSGDDADPPSAGKAVRDER